MTGVKKRKIKLNLVFDENKRRDFLTGFRKRKLQRQKQAKEKLEEDLKKEKKRIKLETKESYKKMVKSYAPLPEVEELLEDEFEDDNVTVKVVELSTNEIAEQNNWIGINQPACESSEDEAEKSDSKTELNGEIPGMELNSAKSKKKVLEPEIKQESKTKAEIKRIIKKQATKTVQKSKAFQQKNRLERQKQRKKSAFKKKVDGKLKSNSKNKRKK